jgi:competence protein ComEA
MAQWLARNRVSLLISLSYFVVTGALVLVLRWPTPGAVEIVEPTPYPTVIPTPAVIQVYVSGGVIRPDVYQLPLGSIVKDALAAAGGPSEDADLERVNLAEPVAAGSHVQIPRKGELLATPLTRSQPAALGKVNINQADAAELETLPGIGPVLARAIVTYRGEHGAFATVDELVDVPGIGDVTLSKIRDLITVY